MSASFEVTLKTISEKQKKIGQRMELCEETVYEMLLGFIELMGTQCPGKLRNIAKRWEKLRDEGQVIIKPKVMWFLLRIHLLVSFEVVWMLEDLYWF